MKLFESFRSAADKYGEALAREMLTAGIPDKYILAYKKGKLTITGKGTLVFV